MHWTVLGIVILYTRSFIECWDPLIPIQDREYTREQLNTPPVSPVSTFLTKNATDSHSLSVCHFFLVCICYNNFIVGTFVMYVLVSVMCVHCTVCL